MHDLDDFDRTDLKEANAGIQVTIESGGAITAKGVGSIAKKNLVLYDSRNDDSIPQQITA